MNWRRTRCPPDKTCCATAISAQPMQDTWQSYVVAENVEPGSVRIIEREGRRVAHFIRQGEEDVPTEVGITQSVEEDVNVYDSLSIQMDVKLLYQSLSGAGYLSSEFPLRVEITYTDIYGKVLTWGHGFYFRDPENENWRIINGEKIPPYVWYTYQSPELDGIAQRDATRSHQQCPHLRKRLELPEHGQRGVSSGGVGRPYPLPLSVEANAERGPVGGEVGVHHAMRVRRCG